MGNKMGMTRHPCFAQRAREFGLTLLIHERRTLLAFTAREPGVLYVTGRSRRSERSKLCRARHTLFKYNASTKLFLKIKGRETTMKDFGPNQKEQLAPTTN
jgi:hypothetical protein